MLHRNRPAGRLLAMTKPKVETLERRRVPSGVGPRAAIAPRPTAAVIVSGTVAGAPHDPFVSQAMPVSVSLPGHLVEADRQAQARLLEQRVASASKAIAAFEGDFTRQLRAKGISTRLPSFLDGLLNSDARDASPEPDARLVARAGTDTDPGVKIRASVDDTPALMPPAAAPAASPATPANPSTDPSASISNMAAFGTFMTGLTWTVGSTVAAGSALPAANFGASASAVVGAWGVFDLTNAPLLDAAKAPHRLAATIPSPASAPETQVARPEAGSPDPGLDAHAEVAAAAVVPDVPWSFEYADSNVPAAYDPASGLAWTQATAWDDLFDTADASYDLSGEVGLFAWLGAVVGLTVATEAARRKLGLTGSSSRLRSKSRSKSRARKRRRKDRRMMAPPAWAVIDDLPNPFVDPGPPRGPHKAPPRFALFDDVGPEIPPPHVLDAELGSDFEIESLSEFEFELGPTSRRFEYEYDLYLRPVEPGT